MKLSIEHSKPMRPRKLSCKRLTIIQRMLKNSKEPTLRSSAPSNLKRSGPLTKRPVLLRMVKLKRRRKRLPKRMAKKRRRLRRKSPRKR